MAPRLPNVSPSQYVWKLAAAAASLFALAGSAQVWRSESWQQFGGNAQHTGLSISQTAQPMNRILWSTPVDLKPQYSGESLLIHYPPPLVTYGGIVLVTVKTGTQGKFEVQARKSQTGELIWTQPTDYVPPEAGWLPTCGSALVGESGMVTPGSGGTVYFRSRTDLADSPIVQRAFYGIEAYNADKSTYDSRVQISTPLTVDYSGNLYFGFRVIGSTPDNLASGLAKISPDGYGSWISAAEASGDEMIAGPQVNCAPAVSNDGRTVYIGVSRGYDSGGYLVGVDTETMKRKFVRLLIDPRTNQEARISDLSSSTPMVGPDGDVYFGVLESGSYNDRGWMLHFDGTLSKVKIPGSFGFDNTVSVLPAECLPSYSGRSKYLIVTKYNNYVGLGPMGDGVNKIAILDPNSRKPDPVNGPTAEGEPVSTMTPILTVTGPTSDQNANLKAFPNAVQEWCVNSIAIDVRGRCAIVNSEDGCCYRWDLTTNTLQQKLTLSGGVSEAYTPTVIGKDGVCFAINNAQLCAIGR